MTSTGGSFPRLDYQNKVILAPMVRIGTLPARLLSLHYGADLVYCEEIIDYKILKTKRIVNDMLGTVDYLLPDDTVVFRTCAREKEKVIFQMGTSDAKRALLVAKKVEADVAGIDVNMGCPKEFSVKGGMGAALLKQPENVKNILTTLVNGLSLPVTCKIRVLPDLEDTLSLVKLIESTGVAAIGVHGRTKEERPRHNNRNDVIRAVTEAVKIPVIANGLSGKIKEFADIEAYRLETGASSIMLARAAQWNFSIFRQEGKMNIHDCIKDYLKYAIPYARNYINVKYNIQQLMHENLEEPEGRKLLSAMSMLEICSIWGMQDVYHEEETRRRRYKEELSEPPVKRQKLNDGTDYVEMSIKYMRRDYRDVPSPKMRLHEWTHRKYLKPPSYETEMDSKTNAFKSIVQVVGQKYSTSHWAKSKQIAEQSAAIVALLGLGEHDGKAKGDTTGADIMPGCEKSRSGENYARSVKNIDTTKVIDKGHFDVTVNEKEETTPVSSAELCLDASCGDDNGTRPATKDVCGTEIINITDQDLIKATAHGGVEDCSRKNDL